MHISVPDFVAALLLFFVEFPLGKGYQHGHTLCLVLPLDLQREGKISLCVCKQNC